MAIEIRVNGMDRLLRDMQKRPAEVQKEVSRVIARYALLIEGAAKKAAPVDTGNLRSMIRTELGSMSAKVISGANYSQFIEFGTSRMRAQPYLLPALEQYSRQLFEDLKGAIGVR